MSSHGQNKPFQYASTATPVNKIELPTTSSSKKLGLSGVNTGTSGAVLGLSTTKAAPIFGLAKPVKKVEGLKPLAIVASKSEEISKGASDGLKPSSPSIAAVVRKRTADVDEGTPSLQITESSVIKRPKVDKKTIIVKSDKEKRIESIERSKNQSKFLRAAGGEVWEDPTLADWDPSHYRLFVGNLGSEVTDSMLHNTFLSSYPSVSRTRIIRDKHSGKTRGYAFIAFSDGREYLRALKEMQGKWIGNRQCIIKKSDWKDRNAK